MLAARPAPVRERLVFDRQGEQFHFERTQEVDDIFEAVHAARDMFRKDTGPGHGRFLGSVPLLVAQIWANECSAPVGTKEWLQYAKRKLKSSDWQKLKVHGL